MHGCHKCLQGKRLVISARKELAKAYMNSHEDKVVSVATAVSGERTDDVTCSRSQLVRLASKPRPDLHGQQHHCFY